MLRLCRRGVILNALGLSVRFVVYIARRILDIAPGLLGFALDLLSCAFGLGVHIASPFADLTLRSANRVVNCTFYSVLIH